LAQRTEPPHALSAVAGDQARANCVTIDPGGRQAGKHDVGQREAGSEGQIRHRRAVDGHNVNSVRSVTPRQGKPSGGRLTIPANDRVPTTSDEDRAVLEANARVALAHATARQDADGIARVHAWFQRNNETA
jgi:hypothetical protein